MSGLLQLLSSYGIPRDIALQATFYPIACLTLVFAMLVVTSRDIFHSAVYLAFALIGTACVYLYLDAEFLAIVQILIYVGAIVTLFIFTIMLTADTNADSARPKVQRLVISAGVTLAVFFVLIKTVAVKALHPGGPSTSVITLPQLGRSLMSNYVLPFEVISLLLLAALVGAIVIGKRGK